MEENQKTQEVKKEKNNDNQKTLGPKEKEFDKKDTDMNSK